MSQADKKALGQFTDATRVHEEGHFTVAEKVASEYSTTVSATGASASEAIRNLQEELNKHQEAARKKLDEQAGDDGTYDKATDRGRKQSNGPSKGFPGEPNINLNCP
jgi:gas vesicle protein